MPPTRMLEELGNATLAIQGYSFLSSPYYMEVGLSDLGISFDVWGVGVNYWVEGAHYC